MFLFAVEQILGNRLTNMVSRAYDETVFGGNRASNDWTIKVRE